NRIRGKPCEFWELARLSHIQGQKRSHKAGAEMTLEVIYKGRLAHRYSGLTKRQAEAAAARYSQYFGKILGGEMTVRVISSAREKQDIRPP
ncbi:hypothetical protein, partial [Alistipes communis]|uniref:hypothetical protein n=1 Tax=Alistipes communis TaxID=2585118 RepID=UPI003AF9875F